MTASNFFSTAGYILFAVGCICFGAFLLVSGIKTVRRCRCKTVGRITGLHKSEGRDKDNIRTTYYSPEFEYEVNGQIYHGIGDTETEHYKKIKIGGNIKVFYDPENPGEHFTKGGGMLPAIFGAVALAFGVLMLLSSLPV